MKKRRALIVIDVQRDFCEGGAFPVPESNTVIPIINGLLPKFDLIIFTQDLHDPNMEAFASSHEGKQPFDFYENSKGVTDILWPDHCIVDTLGARFHPDLDLSKCKKDFYIFKKGLEKDNHPYSAFDGTELREFLDERDIIEIYICGISGDYCIKETAIDSAMAGYDTYIIRDACASLNLDSAEVFKDLKEANVYTVETWVLDLILNN